MSGFSSLLSRGGLTVVAVSHENPPITAGSPGFIEQEAFSRRVLRRHAWLSPEIVAVMVGAVDFVVVPAAAAGRLPSVL